MRSEGAGEKVRGEFVAGREVVGEMDGVVEEEEEEEEEGEGEGEEEEEEEQGRVMVEGSTLDEL